MQPVICIEMLYPALSPVEKIENIARVGFSKVEFWGWCDKDIPAIAEACRQNEVRVVNFSGHRRGSLVAAETHELFLSDLKEAVQVADTLNCSTLMVLSNELGEEGRVLNSYSDIPEDNRYLNLKSGLEKALAAAPEEITLVLEPLTMSNMSLDPTAKPPGDQAVKRRRRRVIFDTAQRVNSTNPAVNFVVR